MPNTASRQNSLTKAHLTRDVSIRSTRIAPIKAPITVPEPPNILTPPTTDAATDFSSNPSPATTVIVPKRAKKHEACQTGQSARKDKGDSDHHFRINTGNFGGFWVGTHGV